MSLYTEPMTMSVARFGVALFFALAACQHLNPAARPVTADAANGVLSPSQANAQVILVSQWHLAAQTSTESGATLPQTENQLAIYRQLSMWVRDGGLQTVIAEGCEGTIDDSFTERFNGWTLADLKKLPVENLEPVMTHVALKLKAEFGRELNVVCGDDRALIKKHQLILSDLRGLLGFKLRLDESRGDRDRYDEYLQAVRPLLGVGAHAKSETIEAALTDRLKDLIENFDQLIHQRNTAFLRALKKTGGRRALVIGALHVPDLRERLQTDGSPPAVFTPVGLKGDESVLIDGLRKILR